MYLNIYKREDSERSKKRETETGLRQERRKQSHAAAAAAAATAAATEFVSFSIKDKKTAI